MTPDLTEKLDRLAGTASPAPTDRWTETALRSAATHRRRARASVAATTLAVVAIAGATATGTLPFRGTDQEIVTGSSVAVPSPSPCADPTAYDLPGTGPDRLISLTRSTGSLNSLQLTAGDLGFDWAETKRGTATVTVPGTSQLDRYADIDARAFSTSQRTGSTGWSMSQSTARMQQGTGPATWQAALDRTLCTTPVHQVKVLGFAEDGGVRWLALRETLPTMMSDGKGAHMRPGPPVTNWSVLVNSGDLLTVLQLDTWGDPTHADSEVPAAWMEQLARAAADRLQDRAPAPLPALQ